MSFRALALGLVLLVPGLLVGLGDTGLTASTTGFPCDTPTAGIPCNLRMTFSPNRGNENYLQMNPANPDNLVDAAKDYGLNGNPGIGTCGVQNVWTGVYATQDGGQTWTNTYVPGWGGGPSSAISGYACATDATLAFDGSGTAYVSGLAYDSEFSTDALWVATSHDGGQSIDKVVKADEENFDDKNWIAVDPDNSNVYVTWTCFCGDQGIYFRRALNGDIDHFQSAMKLSGASSGSDQASFPVVGPDHTIYVVYTDVISGGQGSIYLVKSTDQGASFSSEKVAVSIDAAAWSGDTTYRTPTMPQLAVDRSNTSTRGNLYLVWQDQRNGNPDIYFSSSTDGGDTWSAAVQLNDDTQGHGQNLPALAVDNSNGWVHATWYDRRDDPNNHDFTTYYAVSKDAGQTWSRNQRVGTHLNNVDVSPPPCTHQSGDVFIGDYTGLAAGAGRARPSFVDVRNGRCDLYTALLFAGPRLSVEAPYQVRVNEEQAMDLKVSPFTPLDSGTAVVNLPASWTVTDSGSGTVLPGSGGGHVIQWALGATPADTRLGFKVVPTKATVVNLTAGLDWSLTSVISASGHENANATVLVSYPILYLNLTVPPRIAFLSDYNVTVRIWNVGLGDASNGTVVVDVPSGAIPLPKSVAVSGGSVGFAYGSPASDPNAGVPATKVVWTLPTVPAQTMQTFRLVFQAPPTVTAGVSNNPRFNATLSATAPDLAPLQARQSVGAKYTGANANDEQASVGNLVAYYTGP